MRREVIPGAADDVHTGSVPIPDPARLLDDLNDAQREAVLATTGRSPILAGAGSGKTRVISRRTAYAIATASCRRTRSSS